MNYYNSETLLEQQQEIEKLKTEISALTAQFETVKSLFPLNCLVGCDGILHYPVAQYNKVVDALNAAPQHHHSNILAGKDGE